MKKAKLFLTAGLMVAAVVGAFATSRVATVYTWFHDDDTSNPPQTTTSDLICPEVNTGCVKFIGAPENANRQLFLLVDGVYQPRAQETAK